MSTLSLPRALQRIRQDEPNSLRASVAAEALERDDPATFFADVLNHGCITGVVGSLIYTADTEAFVLRHYEEILWLRSEAEESMGQPLRLGFSLLNDLAWFAFEETASQMANELELAI